MSKSNWKGTSGWSATDDPTGVLTGRVLIASAGATSTASDYLLQNISTGATFDKVHYSSQIEYAFISGTNTHPFASGKLSILARSAGFTTTTPAIAETYYEGQLDVLNDQVHIKRFNTGTCTTLLTSSLPASAMSRGTKHTMEFVCTGVTQVTLQLIVDDSIVANVGDVSNEKLESGYPGMKVSQGTVYVDNFAVFQYTSDGDSSSALWLPSDLPAADAGLRAWYKGSDGVSTTGTSVTQWNDQSGNANTLTIAAGTSCPVQVTSDLNGYDVVEFDGTDDFMQAAGTASLSLRSLTGGSFFAVIRPDDSGTTAGVTTLGTIVHKGTTGSTETRYAFSTFNATGTAVEAMAYYKDQASSTVVSSVSFTTNSTTSFTNYGIYGFVTDEAALASGTTFGFWINGTGYQTADASNTLGTDNTADVLNVGVNSPSATNKFFFDGKIAELILVDGELGETNRQKIEGYLAHRYALTGLLPAAHPYKDISPKK